MQMVMMATGGSVGSGGGSNSSTKNSSASSSISNSLIVEEMEKKTPRAATTTSAGQTDGVVAAAAPTPCAIDQITQSLVQRLQPNEQGKRIRLYRNGDRFFKGVWYTVIPSLRSWAAFLEDLQKIHFLIDSLALPHGVRFLFKSGGEPCNGLEEIQHGQSYVVSSTDKFKSIDYANAAQPIWSFVSNKLSEPPKSCLRETFQREPNEFVKPRIITIIRNGIKPRRVVRHLLNKRTAQSFDMVISDITSIIKLNSGAVRKLYSISGTQVTALADFFGDDFIFIAYGTERICCDDFNVISEEYKRMEIGRMNRQHLQFKLRPTQMRMLRKRKSNEFRQKTENSSKGFDGNQMTDETNTTAPKVELPLDLAERIRVFELLGDGNTAFVYKAAFHEPQNSGQWAVDALKIVRRETLENAEVRALVRTEIELLGALSHEQIVRLRDWHAHSNGDWYIRMELVPDGDLFELLRKKRTFSESEVASCADCLSRALSYLHSEHLIVHRDVKLENLLVYYHPDGRVVENNENRRLMIKLADFGLACQLDAADQLLFLLCGTPTYVAPEVLAEFGYSFKADCWSIGIILYCLLCGFPPFGVDEPDDVLFNRILRGQFHFPSPAFDSISSSAKLLITRLLNTDPHARASAMDVLDWHWTKGLSKCSRAQESDAEEQLAIAITGMLMLDDDECCCDTSADDFAMSESSAEFFFSRRASMDELLSEGQQSPVATTSNTFETATASATVTSALNTSISASTATTSATLSKKMGTASFEMPPLLLSSSPSVEDHHHSLPFHSTPNERRQKVEPLPPLGGNNTNTSSTRRQFRNEKTTTTPNVCAQAASAASGGGKETTPRMQRRQLRRQRHATLGQESEGENGGGGGGREEIRRTSVAVGGGGGSSSARRERRTVIR